MKRPLYTLLSAIMLVGCVADEPPRPGKIHLVVEGWIEEGQAPVVMVTRAVDLTSGTASFDGFVEQWARVSITDDGIKYYLIGRVDKNYMPPFIFTHPRLKGRVGHTYRLLVETENDSVESTVTMLPAPYLRSLECVPSPDCDTLYSITASVDNVETDRFYKICVRDRSTDTRYFGSFLGTFRGSEYNPVTGWQITRGVHSVYNDSIPYNHYFTPGARMTVKVCSLEPALYDFWSAYDSNISLSQNLFFTFAGNCPSNISGGLGYWAAYGCSERSIIIPQ